MAASSKNLLGRMVPKRSSLRKWTRQASLLARYAGSSARGTMPVKTTFVRPSRARLLLEPGAHGAVADEQEGDVVAALVLEPARGAERHLEAARHADGAGEGDDERLRREAEPRAELLVGLARLEQVGVDAVGDDRDLGRPDALADHVHAVAVADGDDVVGAVVEGAARACRARG